MNHKGAKKDNLTKGKRLTFALAFLVTVTVGGVGLLATTTAAHAQPTPPSCPENTTLSRGMCTAEPSVTESVCPGSDSDEQRVIEIEGECYLGHFVPRGVEGCPAETTHELDDGTCFVVRFGPLDKIAGETTCPEGTTLNGDKCTARPGKPVA